MNGPCLVFIRSCYALLTYLLIQSLIMDVMILSYLIFMHNKT